VAAIKHTLTNSKHCPAKRKKKKTAVASWRIENNLSCDKPFILGNLLTIFAKMSKAYVIVVSSPFYGFEP
jgi:hypothetical protein